MSAKPEPPAPSPDLDPPEGMQDPLEVAIAMIPDIEGHSHQYAIAAIRVLRDHIAPDADEECAYGDIGGCDPMPPGVRHGTCGPCKARAAIAEAARALGGESK